IDTGNARPMTPRYDSMISSSKPIQQSFTPPSPTVTIPDFDSQMLPSSNLQEDIVRQSHQTNSSFNAIAGMTVYDEKAKRMGTVKQVGVDATQNVVLIITKNDGSEVSVKWNQIKKIGEIILLGEGQAGSTGTIQSVSKCSSCGFDNKPGSKFCQSCGSQV
ncbi:MAG: PRC-barrel domain-containing protein, partial [Nitrososphaerales archaeon]